MTEHGHITSHLSNGPAALVGHQLLPDALLGKAQALRSRPGRELQNEVSRWGWRLSSEWRSCGGFKWCQFGLDLSWRSAEFHLFSPWTPVITSECPERQLPTCQIHRLHLGAHCYPFVYHELFTLPPWALHLPGPLMPLVLVVSDHTEMLWKCKRKQRFNPRVEENHLDIFWLKSYYKNLNHYDSQGLKEPIATVLGKRCSGSQHGLADTSGWTSSGCGISALLAW